MQLPWSWKLIHKQFIDIQDYNTAKAIKINKIRLCLTWNYIQNTPNIYLVKAVVPESFDLSLKHLAQISFPNCSLHLCFQLRSSNVSSKYKLKKVQQKLEEKQTDGHTRSNKQGTLKYLQNQLYKRNLTIRIKQVDLTICSNTYGIIISQELSIPRVDTVITKQFTKKLSRLLVSFFPWWAFWAKSNDSIFLLW